MILIYNLVNLMSAVKVMGPFSETHYRYLLF